MQYFLSIDGLLTGIIAIFFGFIVLVKNRKSIINQTGFLLTAATALWAFGYWRWLAVYDNSELALFWTRILSIGSTLIPVFYFHWIVSLLELNKRKRPSTIVFYVITAFFLIFSFSPLFIKQVEPTGPFAFWPKPGILYTLYLFIVYFGAVIYAIYLLISQYKHSTGIKRQQIKYVLLGSVLGFGGGATNFFLWYNINILPIGNVLVVFYPIIFSYAIIRHHLMNIKVIATEIFGLLMSLVLLVNMLLSKSRNDFILNLILFLVISSFAILLIRSVLKEVKMREELTEREEELKKANEDLKKLDKAKSEFISIASHQLRTPLSIIKGFASMLEEGSYGEMNEKAKDILGKIGASSDRLTRLINDLLDLSRMEGGQMKFEWEFIKLDELVQSVVEELAPQAEKKGVNFKWLNQAPEKMFVRADKEKMRQVIMNLIDNAIKYTLKGFVEVKLVKTPENQARFSVKDSGIGMDQEEISLIFGKFVRGKKVPRLWTEGVGLGLYVARKILEEHKGNVWAESEGEGKGSTFFVEIPVY